MRNATNNKATTKNNSKVVYWISSYTDSEGQEHSNWARIGVAFTNKDGSQNLKLNFTPIGDGTFHIREFLPYCFS